MKAKELDRLLKEKERLAVALLHLYEETADYIRVNHLGAVTHNIGMKRARKALRYAGIIVEG